MLNVQFKYLYQGNYQGFLLSENSNHKLKLLAAFSTNSKIGTAHTLLDGDLRNAIFRNNLIMVDSLMPEIILSAQAFVGDKKVMMSDLCARLSKVNPLKFKLCANLNFYQYKLKRLLSEVVLGLTSTEIWNGNYKAIGTCIVVKRDQEETFYSIYDRHAFENYLLK